MRLESTGLPGVHLVHPDVAEDERGRFIRTFDSVALARAGFGSVVQMSVSSNRRRFTLRGLHYQVGAHGETKLVRCSRGAVHDVVADLRPASPTFGRWRAFELTAEGAVGLVVPPGCAHGFMTLDDDTEVTYAMDVVYAPHAASGVRYDDPVLAVDWPAEPVVISERDLALPLFDHESSDVHR